MIFIKNYLLINRLIYHTNKENSYRCFSSIIRSDAISSALKKFYLKVHPDLFTQYPKEKDINERSLQLVNAYLSGLQRHEQVPSISVTFFTKLPVNTSSPSIATLTSHRITLNSKDLLTSVNTILNGLKLTTIDIPKQQKKSDQIDIQLKVVEIERFYDFSKIPKISLETWLTTNVELARTIATRHKKLLNEISDKINDIQKRFQLKSVEYNNDWSVSQVYSCLQTLIVYIDKWHKNLLHLKDRRLIFGDKTCLLQDGSLELGANDPPVYWDHVIVSELLESNKYMEKIASYEYNICQYFRDIEIRQDPDSIHLCRAHTYLYHLLQLSQHLDLNRNHDAHRNVLWKDFYLFINPYSSEPSITNSGIFQISAYDATMDILEFMIHNREKANETRDLYEKNVMKERTLLKTVQNEYNLTNISINRRLNKIHIIQCCERLLNERKSLFKRLENCRLKIDQNYNLSQNGTISIPWDWSFVDVSV